MPTSVGVRLCIDAIRDREFVDVLAKKIADECRRPPAAGGDDLCQRRAGAKKIGREAPTKPVPSELADADVLADAADGEKDTALDWPEVKISEDTGGWIVMGGDALLDLSSKTTDSAEERGLVGTDALTADHRAALTVLAGPKVDGRRVVGEADVGVPASVGILKVVTPSMLKRQRFIEDTEHEEAADRQEASPRRRETIEEATNDLSEVFLD